MQRDHMLNWPKTLWLVLHFFWRPKEERYGGWAGGSWWALRFLPCSSAKASPFLALVFDDGVRSVLRPGQGGFRESQTVAEKGLLRFLHVSMGSKFLLLHSFFTHIGTQGSWVRVRTFDVVHMILKPGGVACNKKVWGQRSEKPPLVLAKRRNEVSCHT